MRVHTIAFSVLLALAGCGTAGSFADLQAQAKDAESALEKEFGSKPQVNWRMLNGTLTFVDVIYESKAVSSLSVLELGERTQRIVAATFKDHPKQVVVSVKVP